jgi:hypothetical protein
MLARRLFDAGEFMSSLGIETMPEMSHTSKWKKLWNRSVTVVLALIIVGFTWIVISNVYLLYMGKPLIKMH